MSDAGAAASSAKPKAFKPRAGIVRKSKAEREAHAKEEAEKAAARAAAAAQAAGKQTQASKPNISKKKETVRDNKGNSQSVAGGVFGAGSGSRQGWKRSAPDSGRSELLEGQEGVKPNDGPVLQGQSGEAEGQKKRGAGGGVSSGSTGAGDGSRAAKGRDGPQYESDNEPDEARRDIERIWISSEEEEEENTAITATTKGKDRAHSEQRRSRLGGGLRPVRAPRRLVEEQEAESEKRADKRIAKSSRTIGDDADGYEEGGEMDVDDENATSLPHIKQDIPSSPELSRRAKPGRKSGTRPKDSKLVIETVEERAERSRLNEDIEKLKDEFIMPITIKKDEGMEEEDDDRPDGKLFLFQFPPLVPFLINEMSTTSSGPDNKQQLSALGPTIKSDPDGPAITATSTSVEEATSMPALPKTQVDGMFTANEPTRLPPGRVGKLSVHKSGKVTLDWGGTDMEVRYGTEVNFLQDAVLVETPGQSDEQGDRTSTAQMGTTYALGQVQKKMIVIPDWQKLYD